MNAIAIQYDLFEPFDFNKIKEFLQPKAKQAVFQWDFENTEKRNAMKEIQKALKMLDKKGTIDY